MEIVEASHSRGWIQGVDQGNHDLGALRQLEMTGHKHGGHDTAGNQNSLTDLQCQGRGENGIEGQQEIVNGT